LDGSPKMVAASMVVVAKEKGTRIMTGGAQGIQNYLTTKFVSQIC
jgi:hypothetical protein